MKLLAIDASGLVASVALLEDETLLAEYSIQYKKTHSQTLLPMLDEVKRMTELSLDTVDCIAVSAGPGSFTGLRIGSATAKGMALAMDCPIVSVSTLEALAYNLVMSDRLVCPIMDARRNQVYTAAYRFETPAGQKERRPIEVLEPTALAIEELCEKLNSYGLPVVFTGDGIPVFKERLAELLTVDFEQAPPSLSRQRAASVAVLGRMKFMEGLAEPADDHAPIYLRLSQAERERSDKEKTLSEQIRIEPLTSERVKEAADLEAACFSEPWTERDFAEMVDSDSRICLNAVLDGRVIGNAVLTNIAGEGDISNVAVSASYRKCHVGTLLLKELLALGKQHEIKNFTLEVRSQNAAAIRLYEDAGFVREGLRPGFYKLPDDDALILWLRQ